MFWPKPKAKPSPLAPMSIHPAYIQQPPTPRRVGLPINEDWELMVRKSTNLYENGYIAYLSHLPCKAEPTLHKFRASDGLAVAAYITRSTWSCGKCHNSWNNDSKVWDLT